MVDNLLLLCFASVNVTFGAEQDLTGVDFRHQTRQQLTVAIGVRLLSAAVAIVMIMIALMSRRSFLRPYPRCIIVASPGCFGRVQIGLSDFEEVFHVVPMI